MTRTTLRLATPSRVSDAQVPLFTPISDIVRIHLTVYYTPSSPVSSTQRVPLQRPSPRSSALSNGLTDIRCPIMVSNRDYRDSDRTSAKGGPRSDVIAITSDWPNSTSYTRGTEYMCMVLNTLQHHIRQPYTRNASRPTPSCSLRKGPLPQSGCNPPLHRQTHPPLRCSYSTTL